MRPLRYERLDDVAVVAMRNGDTNRMDMELSDAIGEAVHEASETGVGALVLTGGEAIFSRGIDPADLAGDEPGPTRVLAAAIASMEAVFTAPTPIVAAVRGDAIAGGFVLMCACDLRVVADAELSLGFGGRLARPLPSISIETMRLAMGDSRARAMIMSGSRLSPREALAAGVADEVVPDAMVLPRALELARALATATRAAGLMKRHLRQDAIERLRRARDGYDREFWANWA
jgi:enoyl-CoA hydratase/carnithine racemase